MNGKFKNLVSTKDMLDKALKENYAVAHININSFQWIEAILDAAEEEQSPVIIASSNRLIDYLGGFKIIATMVNQTMERKNITVPVALHLDHSDNVESCKEAINEGYSSVMIDGSHFSLEENIDITKQVVQYAHGHGVAVEGEIGTVGGNEDGMIGGIGYADPKECFRLVKETNLDSLAAALGSVHGPYQGEPKLGFAEMKEIQSLIEIPLVLHGASGIPETQVDRAINLGHSKINVNTACQQAWVKSTRDFLDKNEDTYDVKTILSLGRDAVQQVVQEKMREFRSSNKA